MMPPGKRQMLLWLSLLLTIGFLSVSLIGYRVSKHSVEEGIIRHQLPLTGDNVYSEIQKDLLRPIFVSSVMAQDTFLRDWILEGEQEPEAAARYLREIKDRYSTVASFLVSDRTRNYYFADGVLKKVAEDEPRDAWYFRVRAMTEPFEINVDPDLANRDAMTIFINYRVFDFNGNFVGATGVGLTVDSVRKLIEAYQERFKRRVYFVDRKGTIVLHGRTADLTEGNLRELPGMGAIADAVLATDAKGAAFEYQTAEGPVLLNTRFIPELSWHLLVEERVDQALQPLRRTLVGNLAVSLTVTVIVLLLAAYTIGRFQKRLEEMATTDRLTGVLNRQTSDVLFQEAIRDHSRATVPLSVIFLDLDYFKAVNDRFGHVTGDKVLNSVAGLIQHALRESDMVCRWGGEEFLVLLRDCGLGQAETVAEKIRQLIAENDFSLPDPKHRITVSLGTAQLHEGETLEHLLHRADAALYEAKNTGRNRTASAR